MPGFASLTRLCTTGLQHVLPYIQGDAAKNQRFVFELVEHSGNTFEEFWFQLTPEKAATEAYDIIVIGTGMGGGVIAGDLFDTNSMLGEYAKSVLVIEKGGLTFHSHCLNTARPSGFGEDRGQQNDTFFSLFKEDYQFADEEQSEEWNGGPMFNLGGRGAAWGLFAPRIHDDYLRKKFGAHLHNELVKTWYKEAESLMALSLPKTNIIHQNLMERLNIETNIKANIHEAIQRTIPIVIPTKFQTGLECQWQWGRIASEFSEEKNFDFALGAYSPIDKLLEIAMSKGRNDDGTVIEHLNWKILLNTEVRSIIWGGDDGKRAVGVVVRDLSGNETKIFLKTGPTGKPLPDTTIVLGAGSVGSPAILMRSGMTDYLKDPKHNALHLTDHDLFAKAVIFRYLNPSIREKVGSMKLQSYVRLKDDADTIGLVNMAVDSSSFLPREFLTSSYFRNEEFPKLIFAFILPTELNEKNTIDLDENGEPVLTAGREVEFSNLDPKVLKCRLLTEKAIKAVKEVLNIEIRPTDSNECLRKNWNTHSGDWLDINYFTHLRLGGVAHELGTLPLRCYDNDKEYIVDEDLKLRPREGVHVCDLSIFPFSPEVNPTLTLVALALRLSRTILNPTRSLSSDVDTVYVMNQSGERIKVFVSNRACVDLTQEEIDDNVEGKVLEPGVTLDRLRVPGVDETVMVYKLDYKPNKDEPDVYLPTPVPYIATPGSICTVGW